VLEGVKCIKEMLRRSDLVPQKDVQFAPVEEGGLAMVEYNQSAKLASLLHIYDKTDRDRRQGLFCPNWLLCIHLEYWISYSFIFSDSFDKDLSGQSFVNTPQRYFMTIYDSNNPSTIIPISDSGSDLNTETGYYSPEPDKIILFHQKCVDPSLENDLNSQPQLQRPDRENQKEISENF